MVSKNTCKTGVSTSINPRDSIVLRISETICIINQVNRQMFLDHKNINKYNTRMKDIPIGTMILELKKEMANYADI